MRPVEQTLSFECQGETLLGVLALPSPAQVQTRADVGVPASLISTRPAAAPALFSSSGGLPLAARNASRTSSSVSTSLASAIIATGKPTV